MTLHGGPRRLLALALALASLQGCWWHRHRMEPVERDERHERHEAREHHEEHHEEHEERR